MITSELSPLDGLRGLLAHWEKVIADLDADDPKRADAVAEKAEVKRMIAELEARP